MPDIICDLSALKKLNLERNRLSLLPDRVKMLGLVELKIGHNMIQSLPNDFFSHRLGKVIKKFSVCENNLLELPSSLCEIDSEGILEADFNPLLSPPQYILSEGIKVIQTYLYVRSRRLDELADLLADEDFEFNKDSVTPQAHDVLEDGTGFLQPVDLVEFDAAVHEYINGEFYKCPASGIEIAQRVTELREFRETEIYLIILETFNQVLGKIWKDKKQRKLYSDAVFLKQQRPWGVDNEPMNVWVLALNCLLKDTPKNKIVKKDRPSVYSLIEDALPPMPFPFSIDLLKDSLRLYVSPYGQVADTEPVTYPQCDCIGGPKNKPLRHDPCTKSSVVLCLSVYVEEEADRRQVEFDEFDQSWSDIEGDLKIWLMTEQGKLAWEKEVARRRQVLAEEIELREDMQVGEMLRLKTANKALQEADERKSHFDQGADFSLHGFKTIGDAVAFKTAAEEEVAKFTARSDVLGGQIQELQAEYNLTYDVRKAKAREDILEKYCVIYYRQKVKSYRIYSCYMGLRRPWDGEDGADYAMWLRKLGDKYKKGKMELSETISIEEYIAGEEKAAEEAKKLEKFKQQKSGDDLPGEWTVLQALGYIHIYPLSLHNYSLLPTILT